MEAIAHRIVLAWGWPRRLIALAAGACAALAMPPFNLLPVLAISFTLAIWLIDGATASTRRIATLWAAFAAGWWFGFGFFLGGLWWLGQAFLVEAEQFALLMPLGVVGLPAVLAFFPALGFALARSLWTSGPARLLAFAASMALMEWLRATLFTGFPWNAFGLALGVTPYLDQAASVFGLHGLTFLALLLFSTPALLATGQSLTGRFVPLILALCVLVGLGAYGYRRIPAQAMPIIDGVKLRIMQPSVQQDQRFRAENREQILRHYRELSDRATSPSISGIADVTHLIWPESAFPFLLDQDRRALASLAAFLPPGKVLISGAARSGGLPGETQPLVYNAIQVIDDEGVIRDSYDKVHLVPFGEYLPLRGLMDRLGLRQFITVPGGFHAGTRRKALIVKGLPAISPMICYEAIFPDEALLPGSTRPGLLLNVTNDAWFGQTPGPYQHFAQSRMRAIEQGLPLVRAANSGISAIVDPYGRIIASLPLGATGVVDGSLPRGLENTLFSRMRHALFILMVAFSFGIVFLIQYRSWRSRV